MTNNRKKSYVSIHPIVWPCTTLIQKGFTDKNKKSEIKIEYKNKQHTNAWQRIGFLVCGLMQTENI